MIRASVLRCNLIGMLSASLGLAACATTTVLKPKPGDTLVPGTQNQAVANVSGVQVVVAGDTWKGDPANLSQLFTPVQVTIENHSGKTVRVSYADFSLSGSSGFKYSAIPPLKAKGQISLAPSSTQRVKLASYDPGSTSDRLGRVQLAQWERPNVQLAAWEHHYHHDRFFIAPHYGAFYPGWQPWPGEYPYDPFYYDSLYAYWPEKLPTQDMLSQALPEGAVEDNGKVAGFIYFQSVGTREASVTFAMNLVDASNGQSFGQVSIPLSVTKQ